MDSPAKQTARNNQPTRLKVADEVMSATKSDKFTRFSQVEEPDNPKEL